MTVSPQTPLVQSKNIFLDNVSSFSSICGGKKKGQIENIFHWSKYRPPQNKK